MPLYEFRCPACGILTTALRPVAESGGTARCEGCGADARRIISTPSVHRSKESKVDRLDPRYDRMVDRAMADTRHAEPDRHLARLKPLSDD